MIYGGYIYIDNGIFKPYKPTYNWGGGTTLYRCLVGEPRFGTPNWHADPNGIEAGRDADVQRGTNRGFEPQTQN